MFSRKKGDPLITSIDEERRSSFRVQPSSKGPVDIFIVGIRYHVKDISAAGAGVYRSQGEELEAGEQYPFKLTLPLINEEISGIIRIAYISDRTYHCVFVDLSNEEREKIHFFALEMQKKELRKVIWGRP